MLDRRTVSRYIIADNATETIAFNDAGADVTSSFTGGGSSFVTTGQKIQSVSYNLGTGVTFLQGKTGQLGVMFNYEGRQGFTGYNAQLQGRLAF